MFQKWPEQIFPTVNFGFSHFGLGWGSRGGGGYPPRRMVYGHSNTSLGLEWHGVMMGLGGPGQTFGTHFVDKAVGGWRGLAVGGGWWLVVGGWGVSEIQGFLSQKCPHIFSLHKIEFSP